MMNRTSRTTLIIVVILLLVGVAASVTLWKGKSSYDDDMQSLTRIDFQLDWIMGSYYAPYILADKLGFYHEEGLTVNFIQGKGADTTAKLISEGTQLLGTGNAAQTAIAVAQGLKVTSIAMIDKQAVTSIFSLKPREITLPKDLVGKTLGVRYYDVSHSEYLAMMRAQGIDTASVKEVGVGFDLQPLITGQVDAMYNYAYNMPIRLKVSGYDVNQIFVKDWGVDGYGANIIANTQFLNEHPAIAEKFLNATLRGWQAAAKDPEAAIDALVERYPDVDKAAALQSLKAELPFVLEGGAVTFCQTEDRWSQALETYQAAKLLGAALPSGTVYTNRYLISCPR